MPVYENQAHYVKWVIALDSSYRALVFDNIWLEENKSSCPLIDVWFNITLHHKSLRSLKWLLKMLWYDVMMLCTSMQSKQVVIYTQSRQVLRFRLAWSL